MANEILKDEIMSEEELDNVAGGTAAEMAKDTAFFHAVGLIIQMAKMMQSIRAKNSMLKSAESWAKAISITKNTSKIFSKIRTRCTGVKFHVGGIFTSDIQLTT